MAYKYIVTHTATGQDRLIEAGSPSHAVAFAAKDAFTVERVTDKVAGMTGLALEKVTADKPQPEAEPAGDPPAPEPTTGGKRKGNATGDNI